MPSPAPGRRASAGRSHPARLTDRDHELLRYVAEHRLVLAAHAQALLGTSAAVAYARMRSLSAAGYLTQQTLFHRQPGCYQITRTGAAAVGAGYRASRIDLNCYQHDVGLAWLWLAARRGAFGPIREVTSERTLRSHDTRAGVSNGAESTADNPLQGVRLGGYGPKGRPRVHYPDLVLTLADGPRVAIELELSAKGQARRERILTGYVGDSRIDAVLYLVRSAAIGRSIQASARRVGVPGRVHVQRFEWGRTSNVASAGLRPAERSAGRSDAAR